MTCRLISTQRHTHLQPEYLLRPSKTRIGRHPDNHIVVMLESISRFHSEFEMQEGAVLLRDLGSRNGTYLNGHRIRSAMPVRSGDRIQFGNVEFIYRSAELSEEAARSLEGDTQVTVEKSRQLAMEVLSKKRGAGMVEELAGSAARERADFVFELYQISLWLREHSGGTMDGALVELLDRIFRVVPASRGAVLRRVKNTDELKPQAWQRRREDTSPQIAIPQAITDMVIETGDAILMGDVSEDERFKNSESIAELEISSAICAPLIVDKKVSGLLYLDNQGQPSVTFRDIDLAFVGSVAQELAFVLQTRELMADQHTSAVDLEGASGGGGDSIPLLASIARALGGILEGDTASDRLTVALEGGDLDEARRQWRSARRTSRRLEGMAREMREYASPGRLEMATLGLNDALLEAIDAFEEEARAKGVEIRRRLQPGLPPAELDEDAFCKASLAVLLNAADAVEAGSGVVQIGTGLTDQGALRVEFEDNGPGFEERVKARLFEPYNPGSASSGAGMGLALAKRHVERMGGAMRVTSEAGKGAKITFVFPVKQA